VSRQNQDAAKLFIMIDLRKPLSAYSTTPAWSARSGKGLQANAIGTLRKRSALVFVQFHQKAFVRSKG
jgi:hypothetical protein